MSNFRIVRALARAQPAVLIVVAAASACAHAEDVALVPAPGMYVLSIDDAPVAVPAASMLQEVLRRKASAFRLAELSADPARQPLVVVDDVRLRAGVGALASIPTCDVESVRLVRPIRAVQFYGPDGAAGAIEIRTRRGSPPFGGVC